MNMFRAFAKRKNGGIMLEFVLCFPLLFVIFLFAVQFSQIFLTWQVLHYAAFMGARATLTCNTSERNTRAKEAAMRVLAVVSDSATSKDDHGDENYSKIDGWGYLPFTKYVSDQTTVTVEEKKSKNEVVMCKVKYKMFLYVPVAGKLISYFGNPDVDATEELKKEWENEDNAQGSSLNPGLIEAKAKEADFAENYPYIELESNCAVSIPYDTTVYPTGK